MSRRTQKSVGVIGLGIIGSRVADNLRRRGFHVFVWNRTPRPVPNFVGSPSEVADLCDFIQIFVSDDDAVVDTINHIKASLNSHHVVMVHSTVAPHTVRAAAEVVQRRGGQFIDAPFTGSKVAAEKGELVYYVGGDAATIQRARAVLEASAKEIVEIGGEIGHATTIKVATNMITAATVQAAAEALALVNSAGLPAEKFAAAMQENGSNSGTLAMKLPMMISGNFEPQFSIRHMLKDVHIASRLGRSYGLNFGATEAARDSLRAEAEAGRADNDYSSLVQALLPEGLRRSVDARSDEEGQPTLAGLDEKQVAESERMPGTPESTAADDKKIVAALTSDGDSKAAGGENETTPVVVAESASDAKATPTDKFAAKSAAGDQPSTQPVLEAASGREESDAVVTAEPVSSAAGSSSSNGDDKELEEERRGFLSRVFGRPAAARSADEL